MSLRPIVWAHGLEGSPTGYKATVLRERGFDLVAPDGRGKPLAHRLPALFEALEAHPDAVLVGSSYGGLASTWIASKHPLVGVVLLAPALHHTEPPIPDASRLRIPATVPAIVIHGLDDAIVPIAASRALAQRCPHVALREVNDGHSLTASLDGIEAAIRELATR